MKSHVLELTSQVEKLTNALKLKDADLASKDADLVAKNRQIEVLQEALRLAMANRYGRASERYVVEGDVQGQLFDEAELSQCDTGDEVVDDNETVNVSGHGRKKRGKRQPLPNYLPIERIEYTLPESDLIGPNGEQYVKIGEDISEQLDIIPASVKRLQHVRFKYAVKGCEELGVKTAPITGQPIPKSLASAGLLAHVVQSKYEYHLPLYRQERIWKSLDVYLPRNSMSRWIIQLGELITPLIEYQFEEIKQHRHIHVDETPVIVINDAKKKPDKLSHKGFMWVYTNHIGTIFDYQSSRGGINPQTHLSDFRGFVQSDAYAGYDCLFTTNGPRLSVGCMAHARRKFVDVQKAAGKKKSAPVADYVVKLIGKLYKIERHIKEQQFSSDECYQHRQQCAVPILDKLKIFLIEKRLKSPPKSLLGKAIGYTLDNWDALHRYTDDGILCIDNNPAECAIKPFAVGRKNWLFCGNTRAAKAAANLLSLIESAKLHNLKIFDYLKYVFENITSADTPRELEKLLPMYAHQHLPKMKIFSEKSV